MEIHTILAGAVCNAILPPMQKNLLDLKKDLDTYGRTDKILPPEIHSKISIYVAFAYILLYMVIIWPQMWYVHKISVFGQNDDFNKA